MDFRKEEFQLDIIQLERYLTEIEELLVKSLSILPTITENSQKVVNYEEKFEEGPTEDENCLPRSIKEKLPKPKTMS